MGKPRRVGEYAAKKARAKVLWVKGLTLPVIRTRLGIGATSLSKWVTEWKKSLTCGVEA